MIPTVKNMISHGFTEEQAKKIRAVLEDFTRRFPGGYNKQLQLVRPITTLEKICRILNGCDVQSIPEGTNSRSPAIHYVNMGDTYDTTVMYVGYRQWRIGDWGSIVERGNYSNLDTL